MDMTQCLKDKQLEERACRGVSLLAPAFTICCSPLNATLGEREVCLKLAPSTDYQAAPLEPGKRSLGFRNVLELCGSIFRLG